MTRSGTPVSSMVMPPLAAQHHADCAGQGVQRELRHDNGKDAADAAAAEAIQLGRRAAAPEASRSGEHSPGPEFAWIEVEISNRLNDGGQADRCLRVGVSEEV